MAGKKEKLPRHVAIIMDGNGRWARKRSLPRVEGHIAGIESVRDVVTMTRELGIPYLTLYAFSRENWTRPTEEVGALLDLLAVYLDRELSLMCEKDVRFNVIGETADLPVHLQAHLGSVMKQTGENRSLLLTLALSYSGRAEIVRAATLMAARIAKDGPAAASAETFSDCLYTAGMPDPDLLIRTSGEMRLSNFLLWQMAYTEIYVTDTLWPDFRKDAYHKALKDFAGRNRRFGSLKEA
jgi:undecaprenyl diphosphate synthase